MTSPNKEHDTPGAERRCSSARPQAPTVDPKTLHAFEREVRSQGTKLYRDLPWRNTRDPYGIWISEVMLQQTQVKRVLGRWERFIGRFPTVDALAAASAGDVVEEWQGMGYNRRALALKRAADVCSATWRGALPQAYEDLVALPGIGPATAAGIIAFAYDRPSVYIETNVRAVYIKHFFPGRNEVSDKEIRVLVEATCPDHDVRGWYYALLDYGAWIKSTGENPSRRAKAYTRQGRFEGSRRQKRAWIVREVMGAGSIGSGALHRRLDDAEMDAGRQAVDDETFASIVADLAKEGFITVDAQGVCQSV
jgi:A/G-specific adenine glycosylase